MYGVFDMKKQKFILPFLCCVLTICLMGCASEKTNNTETQKEQESNLAVDYSMYDFAGKQWFRESECDLETLCFLDNGEFRYSCACGNPVNDADVVESYSYDDTTKMFTFNCYEEIEGMVTEIKLISCDNEKLELDFAGEIRTFYIDGVKQNETMETVSVDLTKISPMIQDNASEDVLKAAKAVMEAFLQYENSAKIDMNGNAQRFMNDMAYVIDCTCPMFSAFTDFNEMTSYDEATETVSWEFYVDKEVFEDKLQEFHNVTETYLENVSTNDSEEMKAMLLYYALIDDLRSNDGLLGDNFDKLSQKEADMQSSPYYVLMEKNGICTNIAQAYMFLCTQMDITCGTVLHTGGSGMHMWNIVQINGICYYCDPMWDANTSLKYFGMTAADRASWAGEYSEKEGTMLSMAIPERFDVSNTRFEELREKLPVEISEIKVNKESQTITFVGYDYEYEFQCQ